MTAARTLQARMLALRQILSFAVVGTVGFIVDASVLKACIALRLGLYVGRVLSYLVAVTVTWILNRRYTFGTAGDTSVAREWLRYAVSQLSGAAVNLGVYSVLVATSPTFHATPTLAVAAGSLAGMSINFLTARSYVFRTRPLPST